MILLLLLLLMAPINATAQSVTLPPLHKLIIGSTGNMTIVPFSGTDDLATLQQRSHPLNNGMEVWVGHDGELRYRTKGN